MPYYFRFLWTEDNERHLAAHGVTKKEFEEVVLTAPKAAVTRSRTSDRLAITGYTRARRLLTCVYEEIDESVCHPVTAFDKE